MSSYKDVVIAVDFDGTICTVDYPEIGREREGAKEFINKLVADGYTIVINTCRQGKAADMAKTFLEIRGISYHFFNKNTPALINHYGCDTRKISADVYVDDKCLFVIPSWEEKYAIIRAKYPDPFNNDEKGVYQKPTKR